ncbi:MAG: NUDIX domain-containing protein [Candidatus Paceibacterota bacterium]|jgi:ADP-ribose pyrophosphatase YjhB (NUDIX family)
MKKDKPRPGVGIGVIIINKDGNVLFGKRKGSHAPFFSIPGGRLEAGETFEDCAIREIKEETGMDISHPEVIAVTNNLKTYRNEGVHYISVVLLAKDFSGEPRIMEPEKCEGWIWADPKNIPMPHFDASERSIECYLNGFFYKKFE